MPEISLDRGFLHRSCIQVSSALSDDNAVISETQHTLRFIRHHAREFPGEITRALVWRIADTDEDELQDRLGAWCVLNAVLMECADSKAPLSCTPLAEKINLYLPYLISYRWYSPHSSSSAAGASSSLLNTTTQEKSTSSILSKYGKVVPASLLTGDESRVGDLRKEKEIQLKYRSFLTTWKDVWRPDVYQRFKDVVRQTERGGNSLSAKEKQYFEIPDEFRDSLRRLRRKDPRPSIAFHVLRCYGWAPPTTTEVNNNNNNNNIATSPNSNNDYTKRCAQVPTNIAEIDALDPSAHPRVKQWLHKLVEAKGGCRLCDVWKHTELRCPCELPFIKLPVVENDSNNFYHHRKRRVEKVSMTYVEAVEKLFRYGIRLPLSVEKALDRIVRLIQEESPYEELLEAFDTVRGAITGPLERHALWLHASYMLVPSRTVFDKSSDDALSPAMEKAKNHFKTHRRFLEWNQLHQSVVVLDCHYRRAELPPSLRHCIKEVRDTKSFFFCLIDGSLTAEYIPPAYAQAPVEVSQLQSVKDILCNICLEPFHISSRCTKGTEMWDLSVARIVLDEHNLLTMRYPEERFMLEQALRNIDQDDRKEKEFRKNELSLAVKLIHEARVPYCKLCNIMGHSIRRCEEAARRILHRHHIKEVDMRLNPQLVHRKMKQLRDADNEREERMLLEAWELLGKSHTYPDNFLTAIRELEDAHIPLAAARYSTDAVQGFLLFIKSNDLLQHLQPLRDERFPEVCLFCDSYHHNSELCEKASAEERGFLTELRRYGLTLWQYLRTPERYDECFPTDFYKGRETVVGLARQFEEDYSPGGVARVRFLESNGLNNNNNNNNNNNCEGTPTGGGSQRSFYGLSSYGMSFSQLILRPVDGGEEKDAAAVNIHINNNNNNNNMNINNNLRGGVSSENVMNSWVLGADRSEFTTQEQQIEEIKEKEINEKTFVNEEDPTAPILLTPAGGHGGKRGRDEFSSAELESSTKSASEVVEDEMNIYKEENNNNNNININNNYENNNNNDNDDESEYVAQRARVEVERTTETENL